MMVAGVLCRVVNGMFLGNPNRIEAQRGLAKERYQGGAVSERIRKMVRLRRRELWKESGMDASFTFAAICKSMDLKGWRGLVDDSELQRGARGLLEARKSKRGGWADCD
jgi:hypothetical protein